MNSPRRSNEFVFRYKYRGFGEYTAHAHPGIELHFCEEGEGWFQARHLKQRIAPGRLTVLYAPTFHHVAANPQHIYCRTVMHVPFPVVDKALSFVDLKAEHVLPSHDSPLRQLRPHAREHAEIIRVFQQLSRVSNSDPFSDPRITLYLAELFYIITGIAQRMDREKAEASPHDHYLVDQALWKLQDPDALNMSPNDLADSLGISRGHLWRVFKHVLGVSPQDYILARRMELAKRELAAGTSVADVARLCGYSDTPSFSRAFRRHTGVSPRSFVYNFPNEV